MRKSVTYLNQLKSALDEALKDLDEAKFNMEQFTFALEMVDDDKIRSLNRQEFNDFFKGAKDASFNYYKAVKAVHDKSYEYWDFFSHTKV